MPIYTCNLRALPILGTLVLGHAPPAINSSSMHCIMRSPQLLLLLYSCGQSFQLFHDQYTNNYYYYLYETRYTVKCNVVRAGGRVRMSSNQPPQFGSQVFRFLLIKFTRSLQSKARKYNYGNELLSYGRQFGDGGSQKVV